MLFSYIWPILLCSLLFSLLNIQILVDLSLHSMFNYHLWWIVYLNLGLEGILDHNSILPLYFKLKFDIHLPYAFSIDLFLFETPLNIFETHFAYLYSVAFIQLFFCTHISYQIYEEHIFLAGKYLMRMNLRNTIW